MKKTKLSRMSAFLTASAFLLGGAFLSCSFGGDSDDDGNDSGTNQESNGGGHCI